jgi:hypothetical protein
MITEFDYSDDNCDIIENREDYTKLFEELKEKNSQDEGD